jgi:hypothetical protein
MILAFQILRDLAAQETARDRMIAVASQFRSPARAVYLDFERTRVRAIQRANRL